MAKPTWNAGDLNAVLTTYTQNYLNRKLLNQNFESHPILDDLRRNAYPYDGGTQIVLPVLDGYSPVGGTVTRGATVTLTHVDHATRAQYQPVFYQEPIILDWTDEIQTQGAGAMLRYAQDAVDAGLLRAQEKLVTDLTAATTATNGVGSLVTYIDSTGSVGGINPATAGQTWWAATETNSIGSFATNGPGALRAAWLATSKYKMLGKPTKIYCSVTAYKEYQKSGLSLATIQFQPSGAGSRTSDIGTGSLQYEGIPVVYEPHLDDLEGSLNGVMLGINTQGLRLCEKPGAAFTLSQWVDLLPGGRLARGCTIKWAGNLVMQARSCNFKLTGITA